MYTIGYISFTNKLSEQKMKAFNTMQCQVKLIKNEEIAQIAAGDNARLQVLDALIIEDYELNNINQICELIMNTRKHSSLPLWISASTQKANRTSRVICLQLGADGILDQNDETDESLLMVRNLLKRVKEPDTLTEKNPKLVVSEIKQIQLIPQNLSVCFEDGKEVNLTKLEYLTMEYLHKNARQTMTYEEIYKNVWKDTYRNRKYRVSNLVFHLRQKIEIDIQKPQYIKTIRSKGYMLTV